MTANYHPLRWPVFLAIGALCCMIVLPLLVAPAVGGNRDAEVKPGPEFVLKTVPSKHFFFSRHEISSVQDLTRIEWVYGPKLREAARLLGLRQVGGIEYHVIFDEPKYVDVALQIDEIPNHADRSQFKTAAPFRCLSLVYVGSPLDLGSQWSRIEREAGHQDLVPSGENREIVISREGFDSGRFVTELQFGIR